jgi:hypothetical protein
MFLTTGPIEHGHAILIGVKFSDGTQESLRVEMHVAPNLARAVAEASALAAMQRSLQPGQAVSVEMPYRVHKVQTAPSADGTSIAMRFASQQGMPPPREHNPPKTHRPPWFPEESEPQPVAPAPKKPTVRMRCELKAERKKAVQKAKPRDIP